MAKDTTDKVINLGIIAAVIIGLVFLYKFIKGQFKGGDTPFGSSKTPGGNGSGSAAGSNAGGIFTQIDNAYQEKILNPLKEDVTAAKLTIANVEARKFLNKPGSSVLINTALKSAMKLPDNQFLLAISRWLTLSRAKDFYATDLVGAQIYTSAHSDFVERYGELTGTVSHA